MRTLLFFTLALLLSLAGSYSADIEPDGVRQDISRLQERKLIDAPDYWLEHIVTGGKCDGEKVAALLVRLVSVFHPVKNGDEAIDLLAQRGIVGSPAYWKKNMAPGGACSGENVGILLNRIVSRLPVEPPASFHAVPLDPTLPAALKAAYDVVIAGAGTGGCGAAVQAARMGRTVLLLEETDWIGGQMNAAGVTSMDEGRPIVRERGLYRELYGLIAAAYQPLGLHCETAYWQSSVCVEPRIGRRLLHVLLGDARGKGCLDLALQSRVTKVLKSGDAVTDVEVESRTAKGRVMHSIGCRVLIDATEFGDVIPLTGARYRVGNCISDAIDRSHHVQDNTWTAVVKQYPQGVPAELRMSEAPPGYTDKLATSFARALVNGDTIDVKGKPWTWATFIGYRGMPDSSHSGDSPPITRTHLNWNNDYPASVGEIEDPALRQAANRAMRLKTLHLLYFIQQDLGKIDWAVANDEGYDTPFNRAEIDAWLAERPDLERYRSILYQFSIIPYTRESRRIIGLHTLTAQEIERKPGHPVQFPTTVALGDYAVDLHGSMTKPWLELDLDHASDTPHAFGERGVGPFAIPFECLIPEKIDGFLPAEKNISQSRMANGATRLQPSTLLIGQAAGAIAALAIEHGVQPRSLDPTLVQHALLDAGCTLSIEPVQARWGTEEWKAQQFAAVHHQ